MVNQLTYDPSGSFGGALPAAVLPGLQSLAFDVSAAVPPGSWYATLLKCTVNFTPATTWLQALAWVAFLVPVVVLYVRPAPPARPAAVRTHTAAP